MGHTKTPSSASFNRVSHAFPSLNKNSSKGLKPKEESGNQFRPMFQGAALMGTQKPPGASMSSKPAQDDPLEMADRRGYESGYTAGRKNACELVLNELTPVIDDVQAALVAYDNDKQMLAEFYSVSGLKLALMIVERISGEAALLSIDDLSEVQSIVRDALMDSFQLNLRFNADDYQCIETVAACKKTLEWDKYLQIGISADDAIDSGHVDSLAHQLEWDTIQQKVAATLDKVMAANETRPVD